VLTRSRSWLAGPFLVLSGWRRSISLVSRYHHVPVDVIAIAAVFGGVCSIVFRFVEEASAIRSPALRACLPIRPKLLCGLARLYAIRPQFRLGILAKDSGFRAKKPARLVGRSWGSITLLASSTRPGHSLPPSTLPLVNRPFVNRRPILLLSLWCVNVSEHTSQ